MGLSYNGVDLAYTLTERVEQIPDTDPAGLDQIGTLVRIHVKAVIAPGISPSAVGEDAGTTVDRIRHDLTLPRRLLTYTAGDGTVLSVPAGGDDYTGPTSLYFNVLGVAPGAVVIGYGVECRIRDCLDPNDPASKTPYSSLKWEDSVTYDEMWRATFKRHGLLIVPKNSRRHPDDMRFLVTPGVPVGFRRVSAEYKMDPSGLRYSFSFTDKQYVSTKAPPYPAVKQSGYMIENIIRSNQMRTAEIHLRLEGPPHVNPRDLLAAACRVAWPRIQASKPAAAQNGRVMIGGAVREDLGDEVQAVDVSFSWALKPSKERADGKPSGKPFFEFQGGLLDQAQGIAGGGGGPTSIGGILGAAQQAAQAAMNGDGKNVNAVPIDAGWLGRPTGTDIPAIGPGPYGVSAIKLIAAALNDPCGRGVTTGDTPVYGRSPTRTFPPVVAPSTIPLPVLNVSVAPVPDDLAAVYTDDPSDAGVYEHYRCDITYLLDDGKIVLPVTDPDGVCVVVQTHCPMMDILVEWQATKMGEPPAVPKPLSDDSNIVFRKGSQVLRNLTAAADGVSEVHTACGIFLFSALDPSEVQARAAIPPYIDPQYGSNKSPLAWQKQSADNPVNPPEGGSLSGGAGNPFYPSTGSGGSAGPTVGA